MNAVTKLATRTATPRVSSKGKKAPATVETRAAILAVDAIVKAQRDAEFDAAQAPATETPQTPATIEAQAPATVETTDELKVGPVRFMRNPMNGYLSGARLYSHTVAFIKATTGGVPGVAMDQFRTVVGASALAYHKAKGNLAIGATGAPVLTEQGSAFFAVRKGNEQSLIATFENMFHTGELPSGMMGERHPPVRIAK